MTGKFHFTRWGIVALVVVVALGSIGITYAGIKGPKPPENDVVVGVDSFTWAVSNDDGSTDNISPYGVIDPGDDGLDPAGRQEPGALLDPEYKYDKDVASTTASVNATDSHYITVLIDNAYPCYLSTVFFGMTGCEKVPAQIMAIIVDEDFHPNEEDNDADDIPELTVTVGGIYVGKLIDPGVEVIGDLAVHVEQVAEQNHTYTIRVIIGVDCAVEEECETAYAYGGVDYATCFTDLVKTKNWGWSNGPLPPGNYTFDMYAGAGGCDITGLEPVGTLTVNYDGSTANVTYTLDAGYPMDDTHLYVGNEILPRDKKGKFTVSPGQYPYAHALEDAISDSYEVTGLSGPIYVVAHAVVCWFPD